MSVKELFDRIKIDGKPVENVVQITVDYENTTVVYDHLREGSDPARRAITVESEAVTFG